MGVEVRVAGAVVVLVGAKQSGDKHIYLRYVNAAHAFCLWRTAVGSTTYVSAGSW